MSAGIQWVDELIADILPPGPAPAHPDRPPDAAQPDRGAGTLTCIRLNCTLRGLATDLARCVRCDHPTQLLTSYRFPRSVFD